VLPVDNPIMKAALDRLGPAAREAVIGQFQRGAPGVYANPKPSAHLMGRALPRAQITATDVWLPIIPLCTEQLRKPIEPVARATIDKAEVKKIAALILGRFKALMPMFLSEIPSWTLRVFLRIGQPFIRALARGPLRDHLIRQFGDSYRR
jgi:hypothetical protein